MKKKKQRKKKPLLTRRHLDTRIKLLNLCFLGVFLFLGWQIISIKVFKGEQYTKGAIANMIRSETIIKPKRGNIVDRNQKTLATSVLAYNVLLSPKDILTLPEETRESIYKTLSEKVGQTAEEIKQIVEARPNSRWYELAKNLPSEQVQDLKKLGGVALEKTYIREYPNDMLAAQVLGFFNKNGQGQYGIEQQYESYLVGREGREFSQMQGSQIITRELQDAKVGDTITLTIDRVIQQYVESTMKKYIEEFKPTNASAIIMNPNTGEIYSMYSYPSFNPNQYNNLSEQLGEKNWTSLSNERQSEALLTSWQNHAVQYMYEPGSTLKPLVAALSLQEGNITGEETYNCTGYIVVGDRRIHCWKTEGHGVQTLEEVLANSCNVGMIELSKDIEHDVFLNYIKDYGFGEVTGIGLAGEATGLLHDRLGVVEQATYSMGQTLTVTPIQLITAFSSVINGGYLLQPYVVDEIVNEEGESVLSQKKFVRRQVVSSEISRMITSQLKKVVDEGTGTYAAVTGYDIGGKTGTGEKWVKVNGKMQRSKEEYVVSFMGFAPVEQPEVVGLVVFDGLPEHTGAPTNAFKDMMENILPYLDIEMSEKAPDEESQSVSVPDVSNISIYEAINRLGQKGFNYELVGVGTQVTEQYPAAENLGTRGSKVKLYTSSDKLDQIGEVPDVVGKTLEEAKQIAEGLFVVEGSGGVITSQVPRAGSKIEKGNKIIVKTSE